MFLEQSQEMNFFLNHIYVANIDFFLSFQIKELMYKSQNL